MPASAGAVVLCMGLFAARGLEFPADAIVQRDEARGTIRWATAKDLSAGLEDEPAVRAARTAGDRGALVLAVLDARRAVLGLEAPAQELRVEKIEPGDAGAVRVRLGQLHRGLVIEGAGLSVHVDAGQHVTVVSGQYVRTPKAVDVTPTITAAAAVDAARKAAAVPARATGAGPHPLVWYPNDAGDVRLAFRIEVAADLIHRERVYVDAKTGTIIARIPTSMSVGSGSGGVVGP